MKKIFKEKPYSYISTLVYIKERHYWTGIQMIYISFKDKCRVKTIGEFATKTEDKLLVS